MSDDGKYRTFDLRLPPTLQRQATEFAENEGISLNHLINLAVAEKVTRTSVRPPLPEVSPLGDTQEDDER